MGAGRTTRRASAAPRCVVPRRPHLLESHRGAGRQSAERAGRPAIPRDSLSPSGALERRALRGARDPAGRPAVPPHLRRVPRVPPPPGVRVRGEGLDLRALQEARDAGVGRNELTAGKRDVVKREGWFATLPSSLFPPSLFPFSPFPRRSPRG